MTLLVRLIDFGFGASLFVNALLFISQAARIREKKYSREISLITFLGFLAFHF